MALLTADELRKVADALDRLDHGFKHQAEDRLVLDAVSLIWPGELDEDEPTLVTAGLWTDVGRYVVETKDEVSPPGGLGDALR